ncbi:hypothetical protein [Mariniphaga sp.]|uniref:hypothetical protein n=1 Tax=Mariniphaga sp. TaxID=1954475 RepID=UPI0035628C84
MKYDKLNIELLVSSSTIKLNEVTDFKVGLDLTNESDNPVHFEIAETELYVNNRKSIAWDLAVQNGTIINLKIRPRKSKTALWPLGNALFEKAGKYKLELRWVDMVEVQEVTVNE